MLGYLGRLVVALSVVAGVSFAANDYSDSRDNRVYRVVRTGPLNWFTGNLSYKEGASLVVRNRAFYAPKAWDKACPENTRVPSWQDWEVLIKDQFIGARKKQNMRTFVGAPSGFYEIGAGDSKQVGPEVGYFAVAGESKRGIMLDLNRGMFSEIAVTDSMALPVRCVGDYDPLEEMNVSREKMVFTDPRDGKKYRVELRDSTKLWMKQNLRYNLTSAKQCFLEDSVFCKRHGRFYTYNEALKACPTGWHLPNDGEWRDYQRDQSKLDWDNLGRGGCRDWDEYCDETYTGHYWSSTSVEKDTGRGWEFRRQARSINRTDESVHKGLYVRCVADLK